MALQHLDEPLPDDAGSAQNSNGNFAAHILLVIKKKILGIYNSRCFGLFAESNQDVAPWSGAIPVPAPMNEAGH